MSTEAPLYWGLNARSYCTLIHVSQLSSFVIPSLGIILPIVLWIAHKDQNEDINQHGRVTANWLLSLLVYSVICFILTFIIIGALGFIALGLLNVIFAIVAAVKANKGELWVYPLSFQFIKR
ncbi:DUF4870 domain-containing protein [Alteromonas mediterranea]|uniref:Orotate phosphoribosyltransferase n=1 Tax=Alteromonas mediterranea (strain DSM 17117 / CIP 110805 / LMG 28347 / Deep ecotype) TaxID=1774373 RepID=F2GA96_ALTMD|nr:DUF4870 domain-containing protein [Alteromonas mediterranea]AEA97890.2 hypothetical protein MADE_1008760 [Alteromonas mediterranea DE]CAH1220033.1 hypothetical protein ISS312_01983 [Alteromonas mediterranea]